MASYSIIYILKNTPLGKSSPDEVLYNIEHDVTGRLKHENSARGILNTAFHDSSGGLHLELLLDDVFWHVNGKYTHIKLIYSNDKNDFLYLTIVDNIGHILTPEEYAKDFPNAL